MALLRGQQADPSTVEIFTGQTVFFAVEEGGRDHHHRRAVDQAGLTGRPATVRPKQNRKTQSGAGENIVKQKSAPTAPSFSTSPANNPTERGGRWGFLV